VQKNAEVVIKKAVKNLRKLTMSEKIDQLEKMKKSADKKKK
jgi:large subunit ribosomal protein L3